MFSQRDAKRERDRRHYARRRMRQPWRVLYATQVWQRLRADQLRREPFCRMHAARGEKIAAGHVDHIRAHRGDPALFFDPANLQSLCAPCHNSLKQRHERGRYRPVAADGWPMEGGED